MRPGSSSFGALEAGRLLPTRYISFAFATFGCLQTLKRVPGSHVPVTGPDLANLLAAGLLLLFVARSAGSQRVGFSRIPASVSALLILLAVTPLYHALAAGFRGPNGAFFLTVITTVIGTGCLLLMRRAKDHTLAMEMAINAYVTGIAVGLAAPLCLVIVSQPGLIYYANTGRYRALLEHPNQVGILATIVCGYVAASNRITLYSCFLATAGLIICALSLSKFNLTVSTVMLGFWLVRIYGRSPIIYLPLSLIAFLIVFWFQSELASAAVDVLSWLAPNQAQNLRVFVLNPEASDTVRDRAVIWALAYEAAGRNLPLGVGPEAVPALLAGFPHAHNFLLQYALAFGLPGLATALYLPTLLVRVWLRCGTGCRQIRPLCVGLLAGLFAMLLSDSLSSTLWPFYLFALPLLSGGLRRRRRGRVMEGPQRPLVPGYVH